MWVGDVDVSHESRGRVENGGTDYWWGYWRRQTAEGDRQADGARYKGATCKGQTLQAQAGHSKTGQQGGMEEGRRTLRTLRD